MVNVKHMLGGHLRATSPGRPALKRGLRNGPEPVREGACRNAECSALVCNCCARGGCVAFFVRLRNDNLTMLLDAMFRVEQSPEQFRVRILTAKGRISSVMGWHGSDRREAAERQSGDS
jgi:hypothetical protein